MFWRLNKDFSFYQKFINPDIHYINGIRVIYANFNPSNQKYTYEENINVKIFENLILYENKYCYAMNATIYDTYILFQYKKLNVEAFPNILRYDSEYDVQFKINEYPTHLRIDEIIHDNERSYEIKYA